MPKATFISEGKSLDYTPGAAVSAGDVVVLDKRVGIAKLDIAAAAPGALAITGLFAIAKVTGAWTDGQRIYWDADGDPVGGTAGTGAASTDPTVGPLLGTAVGSAVSGAATGLVALNSDSLVDRLSNGVADPGNAGAIAVTATGSVEIVTAGAETRTLAAPSFLGQELSISLKTDGGDCVITCATTINQTGNNTITLNDAGDCVSLIAKRNGSNLRWSVRHNDGATLSTV